MAKISDKDLNDLSAWNIKELRKLKINCNNRLSTLEINPKKQLSQNHLLNGKEAGELKEILVQIGKAEKKLLNA